MLLSLAKRIKSSGYKAEVIVGISRGGWPPARIMSDLLENSNIANMKVEFYKDIGVRSRKPRITQPVTANVTGKRVLVVDDVADSGHSLKVVANHLRRKGEIGRASCRERVERGERDGAENEKGERE